MLVDKISNFNTRRTRQALTTTGNVRAYFNTFGAIDDVTSTQAFANIFFSYRETGYWGKILWDEGYLQHFFSHWVDGCF